MDKIGTHLWRVPLQRRSTGMAKQHTPTLVREGHLLERAAQLGRLRAEFASVSKTAEGRLLLVSGEAGVGKTALVRHFADEIAPQTRVLFGACDALFTPRPLGPFLDVAHEVGGTLERLSAAGSLPYEFATQLIRDLRASQPTVLILEDLHWADAATLDVLRLLARRVGPSSALVVVTYRDDELDRTHPLRLVLGDLGSAAAIGRIRLVPLSEAAVAELAGQRRIDAADLYRKTSGNPFFVTEVLAAGDDTIPQTVQDAVLARVARLSPTARNLVEAVSIVPTVAESWLIERLRPEAMAMLGEACAAGVLTASASGIAFRHEIARLTIEGSMSHDHRLELHRATVAALLAPPAGAPDPTRLAHHAQLAGDVETVLRFAPEAASRAASMGAHREAAAQYARAVSSVREGSLGQRAELLSRQAAEAFLAGDYDQAIAARGSARECYRQLGDRLHEGDALRAQAANLRCHGLVAEAKEATALGLALLEALPPGPELARAYAQQAMISLNLEDLDDTEHWAKKAMELGERIADQQTIVHVLNTLGTARWLRGDPEGRVLLEKSLRLCKEHDLVEDAGRAHINISWAAVRRHDYAEAEANEREGLAYCLERGLDAWRFEVASHGARRLLDQGSLEEAAQLASMVLASSHTNAVGRTDALATVARIRARRGDPDPRGPLAEACQIAIPTGELQHLLPVGAASAEIAWLEGGPSAARRACEGSDEPLRVAIRCRQSWAIGELAAWRRRAGVDEDAPDDAAEPYALELAGDIAGAVRIWRRLDCRYEAAVVLTCGGNEDGLREALDEFQRLGARTAAAIAARRLRERGARGVSRGPRPSTQKNNGLTTREVEILSLLARGMRNREMAQTLFLSEKTIDHHVSTILRKLGVRSRTEAGATATRLGLT